MAHAAREAVERMPGVKLTAGPSGLWVSPAFDPALSIQGVVVAAENERRYAVELHLIVAWPPPPLAQLAGEIRRRVATAVQRDGLSEILGEIYVHIEGVQDPADSPEAA